MPDKNKIKTETVDQLIDPSKIDPAQVAVMPIEQLIPLYTALRAQKEEIEAGLSEIGKIAIGLLDAEGVKGKVVGDMAVTKVQRVMFTQTTLEQAKELEAVKESVDTAKLKKLHDAGATIPGEAVIEFLSVRPVETKTEV